MPAKSRDLFDSIASFPAIRAAALRAAKGKRAKPAAASFLANLEKEVLRLERELKSGSYRPGRYTVIEIFDPKHRLVSAAPFHDRVVHHAFCAVGEPIFERGFIYDSYANRKGKGTHRAVARYEQFRDRFKYVLRCDIYRYFPTVDHAILKRDLCRRLACEPTLQLADRIIDGSNPQEPVHLYFPGDDLFAPFERRRGLPIGNLTSQFFANVYLNPSTTSARRCCGPRATSATSTISRSSTTTRDNSKSGAGASTGSWRAAACAFTRSRRTSLLPANRPPSWGSCCCPVAAGACRRRTCAVSATGCGA